MNTIFKTMKYLTFICFISCNSPNDSKLNNSTSTQTSSEEVFVGNWGNSIGGSINIEKNGSGYLIKIKRPANNWTIYNGTWSAKLVDGNLVFDAPVAGKSTLIFLKEKRMILFSFIKLPLKSLLGLQFDEKIFQKKDLFSIQNLE